MEAARTSDRLRTMSLVRLAALLPDGRSRAHAALHLAQMCTDEAAALAGRPRRLLPDLADQVAGDALAVCAQDLADEFEAHLSAGVHEGCRAGERCRVDGVCSDMVERLVALRRML